MIINDLNIVLVGGFNPHIIEPAWLMKEGVVDEKREKFSLDWQFETMTGAGFRSRFVLDGLQWEVGLERLKLASKGDPSPAPWIERLLEKLPHTPVRAVGHNFQFQCPRSEWSGFVPSLPEEESLPDILGKAAFNRFITRSNLPDGTQITLTLTFSEKIVVIGANFHRGVKGIEMALEHIRNLEDDRNNMTEVVETISKQCIKR